MSLVAPRIVGKPYVVSLPWNMGLEIAETVQFALIQTGKHSLHT